MKLSVDLSLLLEAVRKMDAANIVFEIIPDLRPLEPIDIQLNSGFECELKDIEFRNGLASYEGRQVLLYIRDHSYNDPVKTFRSPKEYGNKFHIADCEKLKQMRDIKRYDRYVVTNNLSGIFPIAGINQYTKESYSGEIELAVCKYCLRYLNYEGYLYSNSKIEIFNKFSITNFFDTYSSVFSHLPSGISNVQFMGYTADWNTVAANFKNFKHYTCEHCKVNLNNGRHLIHVHHINGVKSDNRYENLMALCADCHRKQPYHDHMFLPFSDSLRINAARGEQNLIRIQSWDDVYKYADPAMHGLIGILMNRNVSVPMVGEVIDLRKNNILVNAGLSWKQNKLAITLDASFSKKDNFSGWKIYNMAECLNDIQSIVSELY